MRVVDFGERHDTRTNGQHYTAADRRPTNQVSAWQAGRESRPTRRHPREETASVEFKLNRSDDAEWKKAEHEMKFISVNT